MALEITDTNFQETVVGSGKLAIVDFWAQWCGPCRAIAPIIEELSSEYDGKVVVGKVDVDVNPEISSKFGIRSIPTILFMKGDEIVHKQVGMTTKASLIETIEANM